MKKLVKITSMFLIMTFLSSNIVSASEITMSNDVQIKEYGSNYKVLEQDNKEITNYTSIDSSSRNNYKVTLDGTFVDDRYAGEMTTILSVKGFIPSDKFIYKNTDYSSVMMWPSKYRVDVKNLSLDKSVKIVDSLPKNSVQNKQINDSISYTIGGGISTDGKSASGSINANYTFSKSVSYEQPDYKTIQTSDSNDSSSWNTLFTETTQGYNLDSWNIIYGNELFMKSRYGGDYETNFLDDSQLSSLISGGFSPNMGLALTAPKGTESSIIEVTLSKVQDAYLLSWNNTQWLGINYRDMGEDKQTFKFEINWKEHTIRAID